MKTLNVIISEDNQHAISDWYLNEWINSLQDGDTAYVATSLMFNELRVGVRLGEIAPFDFEFRGETLTVGSNGELSPHWPEDFADHQAIQIKTLMKGSREGVVESMREFKATARSRSELNR